MTRGKRLEHVHSGLDSFANGGALATADWLNERLDDPNVRIVDARYVVEMDKQGRFREVPGHASFIESHIPGAAFLDLGDLRDVVSPTHIVDGDRFEDVVSQLGIGNDDEVVVYDTDGGVWAARVWWALRLYGHSGVRILDGGFTNWVQDELPVKSGDYPIERARFVASPQPNLRVELEEVVLAMSDPNVTIVDGLTRPFHDGSARLFPRLPAGHIPGAISVPAPDNLDPGSTRLLSATELTERWRPVVDGAERIITYCGAGMYGAFDLFVLHLLGYDAALYDGSWEEWAANEDLPIATAQSVALDQG